MNCEYYKELISASLDGELSGNEVESLYTHLAECRSCSILLADLREQHQILLTREKATLPSEIEDSILAGTTDRPDLAGWFARLFSGSYAIPKPVAWAVGLTLAVLIVISLPRPVSFDSINPVGSLAQFPNGKIQKVVFTDKDIVTTRTYSKNDNL